MKSRKPALLGNGLAFARSVTDRRGQKPDPARSPAAPGALTWKPEYEPTEGWRTTSPEAQGMDSTRVAAAIDALRGHNVRSLVVVRNGYVVAEAYSRDVDADAPQDLRSVTKSVVSAAVGIALAERKLSGLDRRVAEFFPELASDPVKSEITVNHLLFMGSGLEWDNDGDRESHRMTRSPDWVRYVLERPSRAKPGTSFHYSNGDAHLLSAVLQKATGMTLYEYASSRLFEPLGIRNALWMSDPQGYTIGAWSLAMPTRDLAKIGLMYLSGGYWGSKPLLPSSWVEHSLRRYVVHRYKDGAEGGYGYFWWLLPYAAGSPDARWKQGAFYAAGSSGQRLYVVPRLRLIVAMTANNAVEADMPDRLLAQIVQAVRSDKPMAEQPASAAVLSGSIGRFKTETERAELAGSNPVATIGAGS